MAATEELRILLRTVADTSGITKTEQSLKGVQTEASNAGRSGAASLLKFGAAAAVANVAIDQLTGFLGESLQVTRDHERVIRANAMAYGQAAGQYQQFAEQLGATTGFTSDAILQAALSARTLSQNYGLTIAQTQKLITVSADLARVRGIGIAEAFERVQSAIRGEAEASEYLGLTLNDTYLTNQAMNGSLKNTFGTMTDLEKAQVRYNELLAQSAQFAGLAATSTDSLDAAFNRAATSAHNAQVHLGELVKPASIQGLRLLAQAMDEIAKTGTNVADVKVGTFLQNLGGGLAKLRDAASGKSLADLRDNSAAIAEAWNDISQAGERADLSTRVAVTRISDSLADLKDRYVDVEEVTRKMAAAAARVAFLDQVHAAVREITSAQQQQVELQQQSVNLAAEEAQIRLQMLPTQERLAAAQRDVTEQAIRARQAALPATGALDDLRYMQERARLVAGNRASSPEERSQARRDLRSLARGEPGVALAALDAGRGVTLAGRAVERVGLEEQLFQLTQERTLAQIQLAQQTNTLLGSIAEQRSQAIMLTVNLTGEGFTTEVYKQLVEAADQAPQPPVVKLSGVRR